MIYGIGIDLIEISRIDELLVRNEERFIKRLLSDKELKYCPNNKRRKTEFIAGRFAGKEAVSKALGTGIGGKLNWTDMEITPLDSGKPVVILNQSVIEQLELPPHQIHISISHTKTLAIAKVIIEQK